MMGFEASTPFDLKIAWSSDAGSRVLSLGSRSSVMGIEMEYGMCPEERPVSVSETAGNSVIDYDE